ncbi:serine O-acetyltransferase [Glaciecola sp. MF2-115]|uniref:serine O-acetyltransferase n=1 Tax=Glaciecola sp. MF2-115 TaxID=3384827 RepID=UPI00399FCFFF
MISNKHDYLRYKEQDLLKNNFDSSFLSYFTNDIWKFLRLLRRVEYIINTKNSSLYLPLKVLTLYRFKSISKKLGYSIPPNVCGAGLILHHYGNIVINEKCRIGDNCKIHIGVNIGGNNGKGLTPQIGNNCYIGPGAKIFGDVLLGDSCQIGANAVVNKSFPEFGHVIVGIPAKSIRRIYDDKSNKEL